jgi:hypothetical protein
MSFCITTLLCTITRPLTRQVTLRSLPCPIFHKGKDGVQASGKSNADSPFGSAYTWRQQALRTAKFTMDPANSMEENVAEEECWQHLRQNNLPTHHRAGGIE